MQQRLAEVSARDKETQRLAYEDRLTGLANFNLGQMNNQMGLTERTPQHGPASPVRTSTRPRVT